MQNIVRGDLYALWDWQWMTETPVAEWHDWWLHCTHAIANGQNGLVAWASTILFFVKIQHRFFGFEAHFCWCWGFQFATAQLEKCASISICLSVFDRFSGRMRTQRERLLLKHKRYVDSTTISLCLPVCAPVRLCAAIKNKRAILKKYLGAFQANYCWRTYTTAAASLYRDFIWCTCACAFITASQSTNTIY